MSYFKKSHSHKPLRGKGSYDRSSLDIGLYNDMDELSIDYIEDHYDCDCCGMLTNVSAKVSMNGELWFEAHYDGHFGGGDWDGTGEHLYGLILATYLDGNVTVDEEDEDGGRLWHVRLDEHAGWHISVKIEGGWGSVVAYNQTIYTCSLQPNEDDDIVSVIKRYLESEGICTNE